MWTVDFVDLLSVDCGLRELGKCGLCGLAKCGLSTVSTFQVWTVDVKLGIVDLIMGCSVFQWRKMHVR